MVADISTSKAVKAWQRSAIDHLEGPNKGPRWVPAAEFATQGHMEVISCMSNEVQKVIVSLFKSRGTKTPKGKQMEDDKLPYTCHPYCNLCRGQYYPAAMTVGVPDEGASRAVRAAEETRAAEFICWLASSVLIWSRWTTSVLDPETSPAGGLRGLWKKWHDMTPKKRLLLLEKCGGFCKEVNELQDLIQTGKPDSKRLDAYLVPWLNFHHLSEQPHFLMLLLSQRTSHPADWAVYDYRQTEVARKLGVLPGYYNPKTVRMQPSDAQRWCSLHDWDSEPVHGKQTFCFNAAVWTLTAQRRLYKFLAKVVAQLASFQKGLPTDKTWASEARVFTGKWNMEPHSLYSAYMPFVEWREALPEQLDQPNPAFLDFNEMEKRTAPGFPGAYFTLGGPQSGDWRRLRRLMCRVTAELDELDPRNLPPLASEHSDEDRGKHMERMTALFTLASSVYTQLQNRLGTTEEDCDARERDYYHVWSKPLLETGNLNGRQRAFKARADEWYSRKLKTVTNMLVKQVADLRHYLPMELPCWDRLKPLLEGKTKCTPPGDATCRELKSLVLVLQQPADDSVYAWSYNIPMVVNTFTNYLDIQSTKLKKEGVTAPGDHPEAVKWAHINRRVLLIAYTYVIFEQLSGFLGVNKYPEGNPPEPEVDEAHWGKAMTQALYEELESTGTSGPSYTAPASPDPFVLNEPNSPDRVGLAPVPYDDDDFGRGDDEPPAGPAPRAPNPDVQGPRDNRPPFVVSNKHWDSLMTLLGVNRDLRGQGVRYTTFERIMKELGCELRKVGKGGASVKVIYHNTTPIPGGKEGYILIHKPSKTDFIENTMLDSMAEYLKDRFGWRPESFVRKGDVN